MSVAIVFGASGGIGSALVRALEARGTHQALLPLSRSGTLPVDVTSEATIAAAASHAASLGEVRLVLVATGLLQDDTLQPEKSWRQLDAEALTRSFAVNAIGPALVMKHMLPLLPRQGRSVFAALSAKVGSIADNRLGGWYGYRASKAALNQLVRTGAIELSRSRPDAICVAMHPGTTETGLSRPFAKVGLDVQTPDEAAEAILTAIDGLTVASSGGFFDRDGSTLPW